jgi:hypothetical protein
MAPFSVIQPPVLIESPADESEESFCATVDRLVVKAYKNRRPEWLRFSRGSAFMRGGVLFREVLFANAGPLMVLLMLAQTDQGIQRALIYRADVDAVLKVFEIRNGINTEICSNEIQTA